jgi:hypothetical protein
VAGFISEWWPESNRNGGRHQIGIPGRIASEFASIRDVAQTSQMRKKRTFLHRVANWSDPTHRGRLGKGVGLPSAS